MRIYEAITAALLGVLTASPAMASFVCGQSAVPVPALTPPVLAALVAVVGVAGVRMLRNRNRG